MYTLPTSSVGSVRILALETVYLVYMFKTLKRLQLIVARDGLAYTARRILAWLIAHSPLAYRLSFPYYQSMRLLFTPSMLTYRIYADRRTRNGDIVALERYVKKGATVLDVGANAGTFTLVAAALAGPTGRVVAFEPSPKFATIIERNIMHNAIADYVAVKQVALGNVTGTVCLNEAVADDTTNYVTSSGTAVPQATLDSFTTALPTIDLLKIDAEGSELAILEGASETLAKTNVMLFEICNKTLRRQNVDVRKLYQLLATSFTLYYKNGGAPFVFDPNEEYNTDLVGYHKENYVQTT